MDDDNNKDDDPPIPPRKSRGRKPQGEFVWVKDGKTEYLAQAVQPLALSPPAHESQQSQESEEPQPPLQEDPTEENQEDEEEDDEQIEVRWTHNGVFEWVSRSSVRVLWQQDDERTSSSSSSSLPPRQKRRTSTRKTPTKTIHMKPPSSFVTKKRKAAEVEDPGNESLSHPEVETNDEPRQQQQQQPVPKKSKMSHDTRLPLGWTMVSTLSTHAALVKKSFLHGCQEIYKELLGGHPSSSSSL